MKTHLICFPFPIPHLVPALGGTTVQPIIFLWWLVVTAVSVDLVEFF